MSGRWHVDTPQGATRVEPKTDTNKSNDVVFEFATTATAKGRDLARKFAEDQSHRA